jgi:hypothetical protein
VPLLLIQLGDVLNFNKENCGAPFTSLRFLGSTSGLDAGAQMSDVTLGASKDGSLARRDLKFNLIAGYFPHDEAIRPRGRGNKIDIPACLIKVCKVRFWDRFLRIFRLVVSIVAAST